jgi:cation diffusion facilitator CzcD-associated flavoprotein CzcO
VILLPEDEWCDHDFTGERVAVLADGDEAARIVPTLLRTAASVKLFQREPTWVLPVAVPVPVVGRLAARLNLRASITDPWTRRLLTPRQFGRSDVALSRRYYRALRHPRCTLVAWPVYAITDQGIRTAEGIEHRVDTVVVTSNVREELAR